MPMMVSAEEVEIDGLWYNLVSKVKTAEVIQSKNTNYFGIIEIPSTVIYEGVEYNVTSIGDKAFHSCTSLTSISIPSSIKTIGTYAFYKCTRLQIVNISDLSAWCNIPLSDYYSNPIYYSHSLFLNNQKVTDLIIPDEVTSLGDYTFYNCSSLSSVTIPNNVSSIGNNTFSGCSGIVSLVLTNSISSIGDYSFSNCSRLTSLAIPNSVTSIGDGAFTGCSGLTEISLSKSMTSISNFAFSGCSSLTSIDIPSNINTLGYGVFKNCSSLISISIPNSICSINNNCFSGCSALTTISIGTSVGSIMSGAFTNCQDLTDVYCYSENVPYTDDNPFEGSYIEYATLHVPEIAYESYKNTAPWSNFGTIKTLDGETPIVEKCATPTITYANGKVKFACETEGVEFVPSIMVTPNQLQNGNELAIDGNFTVSVYAVKEGYDNSDTATMTINMSQMGDVNADGELNAADITAVVNAILGK